MGTTLLFSITQKPIMFCYLDQISVGNLSSLDVLGPGPRSAQTMCNTRPNQKLLVTCI